MKFIEALYQSPAFLAIATAACTYFVSMFLERRRELSTMKADAYANFFKADFDAAEEKTKITEREYLYALAKVALWADAKFIKTLAELHRKDVNRKNFYNTADGKSLYASLILIARRDLKLGKNKAKVSDISDVLL
jgi:hypothetical protein